MMQTRSSGRSNNRPARTTANSQADHWRCRATSGVCLYHTHKPTHRYARMTHVSRISRLSQSINLAKKQIVVSAPHFRATCAYLLRQMVRDPIHLVYNKLQQSCALPAVFDGKDARSGGFKRCDTEEAEGLRVFQSARATSSSKSDVNIRQRCTRYGSPSRIEP